MDKTRIKSKNNRVDISQLNNKLVPSMKSADDYPVLAPLLIKTSNWQHLSVELTSKCNLRCVYCGKSRKSYNALPGRDEHMSETVRRRVMDLAGDLAFPQINFNGTGEISIFPKWWESIDAFKRRSKGKMYVVTNFAKAFDDDELKAFLKFDRLYISVDTPNRELLMQIRRKVDIRIITYNIARLHSLAIRNRKKPPWLRFNCVVSDLSGPLLDDLASFAAAIGIDEIEMFPMNGGLNNRKGLPQPPYCLDEEQLRGISLKALAAKSILESRSKSLLVTEELRRLFAGVNPTWASVREPDTCFVSESHEKQQKKGLLPKEHSETRLCLQPWRRLLVGADGHVYPCCRKAKVLGNLNDQTSEEIINGKTLMSLRKALLVGDLKKTKCLGCANAPIGSITEMRRRVAEALSDE